MSEVAARGYAHPEALVSTEWVADHLQDPAIRLIESNEDQLLYKTGHIPGACEVDWVNDLNQPVVRDYLHRAAFEELASKLGLTKDTTAVFYGDKNNWWAAYALWVFQLFGHTNARIMDGGRMKWEQEKRALTKAAPNITPTRYQASERKDSEHRAFRDEVLEHLKAGKKLVDVRSPDEFSGKKLHMEGYPNEGALRGGHIPGALNVPWAKTVVPETGEFKTADELRQIYEKDLGLRPSDDVITYCRIGERSAHSWFVLSYLLGYSKVRNYDGSWTEWGNMVNVPIERS